MHSDFSRPWSAKIPWATLYRQYIQYLARARSTRISGVSHIIERTHIPFKLKLYVLRAGCGLILDSARSAKFHEQLFIDDASNIWQTEPDPQEYQHCLSWISGVKHSHSIITYQHWEWCEIQIGVKYNIVGAFANAWLCIWCNGAQYLQKKTWQQILFRLQTKFWSVIHKPYLAGVPAPVRGEARCFSFFSRRFMMLAHVVPHKSNILPDVSTQVAPWKAECSLLMAPSEAVSKWIESSGGRW